MINNTIYFINFFDVANMPRQAAVVGILNLNKNSKVVGFIIEEPPLSVCSADTQPSAPTTHAEFIIKNKKASYKCC